MLGSGFRLLSELSFLVFDLESANKKIIETVSVSSRSYLFSYYKLHLFVQRDYRFRLLSELSFLVLIIKWYINVVYQKSFRLLSELSFLVYKDRYSLGLKLTYNVSVSSRSYLFSYTFYHLTYIKHKIIKFPSPLGVIFSRILFYKKYIKSYNYTVSVSSRSYLFSYKNIIILCMNKIIICFRLLSELSFLVFFYFHNISPFNFENSFRLLSELSFLVSYTQKIFCL